MMKPFYFIIPIIILIYISPMFGFFKSKDKTTLPENIYGFDVKKYGSEKFTSLEEYKGDVLLIVNVASNCKLAKGSYEKMKLLIEKYKNNDFNILLFPCGQFLDQEFKDGTEIKKFADQYSEEFVMMSKTIVKGKNIDPLFDYLIKKQEGVLYNDIKWNFSSFLINRRGEPICRFGPGQIPAVDDKVLIECLNEERSGRETNYAL